MDQSETVVFLARKFRHVREAGPNKGLRVEAIQRWGGGHPGDSWCCWWATMVLDLAFEGASPLPRHGSCEAIKDLCAEKGWLTDEPGVGDLFFYVNDAGHAHHVGIVTGIDPLIGIAGNTSADGKSANGDRVAERPISAKVFVAYPR